MFKTLITKIAAVAVLVGSASYTAPAKADDDVITGVILGAIVGGTIAVLADRDKRDKRTVYSRDRRVYDGYGGQRVYRQKAPRRPHVVYRGYDRKFDRKADRRFDRKVDRRVERRLLEERRLRREKDLRLKRKEQRRLERRRDQLTERRLERRLERREDRRAERREDRRDVRRSLSQGSNAPRFHRDDRINDNTRDRQRAGNTSRRVAEAIARREAYLRRQNR